MLAIEFEADVRDGVIEVLEKETAVQYSDEYIEKHWRELIVQRLSHYDDAYYKSDQYMLDRGRQGEKKVCMKHVLLVNNVIVIVVHIIQV